MGTAHPGVVKHLLWTALGLACCAVALSAATLERLSLDDMIAKSTTIVRAKVLNSFAVASGPVIYTHYRLQVSETLKGSSGAQVEIQLPGGAANNTRQNFAGVPQFNTGDEFVFFLWSGRTRSMQVLGLTQGLFSVPGDGSADPVMTRMASAEVMLERGTGKQVRDRTLTIRLNELRSRIGATPGSAQGTSK